MVIKAIIFFFIDFLHIQYIKKIRKIERADQRELRRFYSISRTSYMGDTLFIVEQLAIIA